MKITDKDLQRLYRAHIIDKTPLSRSNCPSPKKVIHSFKKHSSEREKRMIIDHITQCIHCAREFDFIRQTLREETMLIEEIGRLLPPPEKSNLKKKIFSPQVAWKYASLALAAILLIFSLIILFNKNPFQFLGDNASRGKIMPRINLIGPVGRPIPRHSLIFKWSKAKNSDHYALEIFDETLLLIWKSPKILDNQYRPPGEILNKLRPSTSYFWMVSAFTTEGNTVDSRIEEFSLTD